VAHKDTGLTTLVTQWQTAPVRIVLATAGLPVVVVNPRQVRAFAHALGLLAKTDRIDVRGGAHFAEAVRPTSRPLPDAEPQELRALVLRCLSPHMQGPLDIQDSCSPPLQPSPGG
jgi:hypothetical protein